MSSTPKLLDQKFKWTPSYAVNVQETWKRYGWKPVNGTEFPERYTPTDTHVAPEAVQLGNGV